MTGGSEPCGSGKERSGYVDLDWAEHGVAGCRGVNPQNLTDFSTWRSPTLVAG